MGFRLSDLRARAVLAIHPSISAGNHAFINPSVPIVQIGDYPTVSIFSLHFGANGFTVNEIRQSLFWLLAPRLSFFGRIDLSKANFDSKLTVRASTSMVAVSPSETPTIFPSRSLAKTLSEIKKPQMNMAREVVWNIVGFTLRTWTACIIPLSAFACKPTRLTPLSTKTVDNF